MTTFGDLRSALQQPASREQFVVICELLKTLQQVSPQTKDVWLTYAQDHLKQWPESYRALEDNESDVSLLVDPWADDEHIDHILSVVSDPMAEYVRSRRQFRHEPQAPLWLHDALTFDLDLPELERIETWEDAHDDIISHMSYLPKLNWLLSVSKHSQWKLWDMETGQCLQEQTVADNAFDARVHAVQVRDGAMGAIICRRYEAKSVLHVIDLTTGDRLWTLEDPHIEACQFSRDGRYLSVAYRNELHIVDTTSWVKISWWPIGYEYLSISHYGKYWYSQFERGVEVTGPMAYFGEWRNDTLGTTDNMFWGDLLEDNQTLALALYSQTVLLWDVFHQKAMGRVHLNGAWSPYDACLSSDRSHLAVSFLEEQEEQRMHNVLFDCRAGQAIAQAIVSDTAIDWSKVLFVQNDRQLMVLRNRAIDFFDCTKTR